MTAADRLAQTVAENRQHILDAADDLNDAKFIGEMELLRALGRLPLSTTTSMLANAVLSMRSERVA